MKSKIYLNTNDYIKDFPESIQKILKKIRTTIQSAAPDATEGIAYGMPAYKLNGKPLVYFAGYPKHIGFYATPTGHEAFKEELSKYKQGKGSVQFPTDQAIPYPLISRIVKFRVAENSKKTQKNLSLAKPNSKKINQPGSEEENLYQGIAQSLQKAVSGQMFGKPCLKINGKAFACFFEKDMVFKLTGSMHQLALNYKGAKLFDPGGKNRPMKEWVQVPSMYASKWIDFAKEAMKYVESQNG